MSDKSYTHKNLLDNGYTTTHEDGSKSYINKNLMDHGYTVTHPDGTKSTIQKNLTDDGYTIYHSDGSKSYAVKNLTDDNYTIHHPDGSKSYVTKNLLSGGFTTYNTDALLPASHPVSGSGKATAQSSGSKPVQPHYKEYVYHADPEDSKTASYAPQARDYTLQEAEAYAEYAAFLLLKEGIADFIFLKEKVQVTKKAGTGFLGLHKEERTVSVDRPVSKAVLLREVRENFIGQNNTVENEGHTYKTFLTYDGKIRYEHHTETDYYDGRSKDEYENHQGLVTDNGRSKDNRCSFNHIASIDCLLQKKNIQMTFDTFLQSGGKKAHPIDQKLVAEAANEIENEKKRQEAKEKKDESATKSNHLLILTVPLLVIAAFVVVNLDKNDNKYFLDFFLAMGLICAFLMEWRCTFKYTETSVMTVSLIEAGLVAVLLKYTFTNMHYAWLSVPIMILIFILAAISRSRGKRSK